MERMGNDFKIEYKSITGAIRKPLYFSECKRFIFVECKYTDGIILKKWFWSNHRIFN
jgi:hypothetical protein